MNLIEFLLYFLYILLVSIWVPTFSYLFLIRKNPSNYILNFNRHQNIDWFTIYYEILDECYYLKSMVNNQYTWTDNYLKSYRFSHYNMSDTLNLLHKEFPLVEWQFVKVIKTISTPFPEYVLSRYFDFCNKLFYRSIYNRKEEYNGT